MTVVPTSVEKFRRELRAGLSERSLSGTAYFALLNIYLAGLVAACLWMLDHVRPIELSTLPASFLYINLVEYWAHRLPMHKPMPLLTIVFKGHTLQHHRYFTKDAMECRDSMDLKFLFFPPSMILFFTVAFALPMGFILLAVASANVALLFVITAALYYLSYEYMHAAYHLPDSHWVSRLPGIKTLRRSHRLHHDHHLMSHANFNITFPIGDLIFGTRVRDNEATSPSGSRAP